MEDDRNTLTHRDSRKNKLLDAFRMRLSIWGRRFPSKRQAISIQKAGDFHPKGRWFPSKRQVISIQKAGDFHPKGRWFPSKRQVISIQKAGDFHPKGRWFPSKRQVISIQKAGDFHPKGRRFPSKRQAISIQKAGDFHPKGRRFPSKRQAISIQKACNFYPKGMRLIERKNASSDITFKKQTKKNKGLNFHRSNMDIFRIFIPFVYNFSVKVLTFGCQRAAKLMSWSKNQSKGLVRPKHFRSVCRTNLGCGEITVLWHQTAITSLVFRQKITFLVLSTIFSRKKHTNAYISYSSHIFSHVIY